MQSCVLFIPSERDLNNSVGIIDKHLIDIPGDPAAACLKWLTEHAWFTTPDMFPNSLFVIMLNCWWRVGQSWCIIIVFCLKSQMITSHRCRTVRGFLLETKSRDGCHYFQAQKVNTYSPTSGRVLWTTWLRYNPHEAYFVDIIAKFYVFITVIIYQKL